MLADAQRCDEVTAPAMIDSSFITPRFIPFLGIKSGNQLSGLRGRSPAQTATDSYMSLSFMRRRSIRPSLISFRASTSST